MPRVPLDTYPRLRRVADTLREVSGLTDPQQVQLAFSRDLQEFNPIQGYVSLSRRGLPDGAYKVTGVNAHNAGFKRKDPWKHWDELPTHTGGLLGDIIQHDSPQLYHHLDLADDPVLGPHMADMHSLAAIPLYDQGRALNWAVAMREEPDGIDPQTVENFLMRGNLIGRMTKNLVDQRKLERLVDQQTGELQRIAMIQQALLPERTPKPHGLHIATSYLTSTESGGDFFDFFDRDDGWFTVLVADVAGHGAGAAVVVAMIQAILHTYPQNAEACPSCILAYLNEHLSRKRIENSFVTAVCALFSPDRRTLRYANAGHNRPILRRAPNDDTGDVLTIDGAVSVPLGVLDDARYTALELDLQHNDTLVFYTDGIVEAFSPGTPDTREQFGAERLNRSLAACSGAPDRIVEHVHADLYKHTGVRSRADDQTIVAVRVGSPTPTARTTHAATSTDVAATATAADRA